MASSHGQGSDDALSRAHALHEKLLATPVAERTAASYEDIITLLQPLWSDPQAPQADDARFEAAGLYVGEARDLGRSAGYDNAARTLLELLHTSPYTAYRRNAEFALAQIQIFHLHEARAANVWLRDFEQRYPADPRVAIAREEVGGEKVPEPAYFREPASTGGAAALAQLAADPPPAVAMPAAAQPAPVAAAPARSLELAMGNIRGIQVFSNAGASSVVIALRQEVTFRRGAIAESHLAYFDISGAGARPGRETEQHLAVHDGRIQEIRIAAHGREYDRVVIVTTSGAIHIDRGRIFPNPSRLIIGVTGGNLGGPASPPVPAGPQPAPELTHGAASLTRALGLQVHRIVLDAGHGGHDSGTIGPDGVEEKNVVLDVTLRLGKMLEQRLGMEVVYTRRSDVFIPLEERTAIANRAQADLFLSIHANSNPDPAMSGVETYFLDITNNAQATAVAARENAGAGEAEHDLPALIRKIAWNDKMQESHTLATDLETSLSQASHQGELGVKSAPFVVLIGARMPSVLAEITFLSNRGDERRAERAATRQQMAQGLYDGLVRYMRSLGGKDASLAALRP